MKALPCFHSLFQGRRNPPFQQFLFGNPGGGNHMVVVADDCRDGAHFGQDIRILPGIIPDFPHRGIFFKDYLPIGGCINFQRVTFPDTHGAPDFLGNHHAAQVVNECQDRTNNFLLTKKPVFMGIDRFSTDRANRVNRCYFRTKRSLPKKRPLIYNISG